MHNLEENSRRYIFSRVAIKHPSYAIVKYIVVIQEIKLRKRIWIAACPLDKIRILFFAKGHYRLVLYPFLFSSNCHRNYKRTGLGKRPKKIIKSIRTFEY